MQQLAEKARGLLQVKLISRDRILWGGSIDLVKLYLADAQEP